MSSILENPSVSASALRLDVQQYHKLCASGIIPERTELLSGVVIEKMGKSPLHTWTVQFLSDWFEKALAADQSLRVEQPITLTDSEPEPDLAIVQGTRDDFMNQHPTSADLVVEVAITTVEVDRAKAAIYASAGIPEYWLVQPNERKVTVFTTVKDESYQSQMAVEQLEFRAESLAFDALFPPAR